MPRTPDSSESLVHLLLINAGGKIHEYTCQRGYFLIRTPCTSQMWKSQTWAEPSLPRSSSTTSIQRLTSIKQE